MPVRVTNLVDHEEIDVKFTAPRKTGTFTYTMCLKSDSYVDMDLYQNLKVFYQHTRLPSSLHAVSCHGPVVSTPDSQMGGRGLIPVRGKNLGSNVYFLVMAMSAKTLEQGLNLHLLQACSRPV